MKISHLTAALILGGILISCGETSPAPKAAQTPPVGVPTITASKVEWPSVYEAVGTVRARTAATISSKVMGYVREVKVQAGDRVRAGQLLVLLDSRDLEAGYRQAEAGHKEAQSALPEVDNAIAAAKAQLELAQITFKRMKDLFEKKSISNQEFDEAAAKVKMAQAHHEMALSKKNQLTEKIQQAGQSLKAADVMKSFSEITAPFAGTVTEKTVDPGNLAAPGAGLLTIEQDGNFRLEASLEESLLPSVRVGQPVKVSLEALQRDVEARVSEVVPTVDAASRAFIVKIDLPSLPRLRSGLFGRARLTTGVREVLAVPSAAVLAQGQVHSVFVMEGGVARGRLVTLGERRSDQVEVLSGLSPGEKVIYPRPASLADGARVEVRP